MKRILPLLLATLLVSLSSCGSKEPKSEIELAASSPVVETELIAGFEIGMSDVEQRAALTDLYRAGRLTYDADHETGLPRRMHHFAISSIIDTISGAECYLSLFPQNVDGRLARLTVEVAPADSGMLEYGELAKAFEMSPRGKGFKKIVEKIDLGQGETGAIVNFYKDNLLVTFSQGIPCHTSNRRAEQVAIITYTNIPDIEALQRDIDEAANADLASQGDSGEGLTPQDNTFVLVIVGILFAVAIVVIVVMSRREKRARDKNAPMPSEQLATLRERDPAPVVKLFGAPGESDAQQEDKPWRNNGASGLRAFAGAFVVLATLFFILACVMLCWGAGQGSVAAGLLNLLLLAAGGVGCLFLRLACLALAAMADAASRYLDRESPAEP